MLGTPDEPDVEVRVTEVARLVAAYGQRFVRPPIEVLKALPVHIVEGSEPLEGWVDIPLWTEREAPSDLVIRMRLVSQGWSVHSELVGIRLEAPTVRGTPPPPVPRVVPDVPAPVEPLGPGEYPGDFGPVPEKWRPLIAAVVHRLVEKDYVGLAADGTYTGDPGPNGDGVGFDIKRYPATLRDLPEEIWGYSDHYQAYDDPNVWVVIVPLATIEEGLSSLSLVGQITDNGVDPPEFHLDIVEVL